MNLADIKSKYNKGIINKQEYIKLIHNIHLYLFEYSDFIKNTDIKQIEISDGCVIMTSRQSGIKMICTREAERTAPIEILNFDYYEKDDFNMIMNLVNGCKVICDIGANIGWYSLNIAKTQKDSKVLAFEPIPQTFSALEKNIKLNEINNIQAFNFGFSDEEKETIFYYRDTLPGNASLVNLASDENIKRIKSKVIKLDQFVLQHGFSVDFMKCDVEGAELLVFKGGMRIIERDKPIIFSEMLRKWSAKFRYHPNEIIELLARIGYKCFTTNNNKLVEFKHMDDDTVNTNFFFLHKDKHDLIMGNIVVLQSKSDT